MHLSSLKRRFMMKHMPDVLTATSDAERDRQRQLVLRATAERGAPLPMAALSFCRSYGVTLADPDILTAFFGIGHERLFHAETLLMGSDLASMSLLDDLLQVRARETINFLPEDLRPNMDQFVEEERQHYHLWLMSHPRGMKHAQSLVVSSLRHALHRLVETMAYGHLRELIPSSEVPNNAPLMPSVHAPEQDSRPTLNAALPYLATILEEHVMRLAPIYEGPRKLIAGDGTLPDDPVARRSEYIVLDPEAFAHVRLSHFERDLHAGATTTPYPVWAEDVRKRVSPRIREQLAEVVARISPAVEGKVVSMDDYRTRRSHRASRRHG